MPGSTAESAVQSAGSGTETEIQITSRDIQLRQFLKLDQKILENCSTKLLFFEVFRLKFDRMPLRNSKLDYFHPSRHLSTTENTLNVPLCLRAIKSDDEN